MKLRNKKTGEIVDTLCRDDITKGLAFGIDHHDGNPTMTCYNSLAELTEEWEDYEEPKGIRSISASYGDKRITIEFSTREETVEAYEKLTAWKQLKNKGFRFEGIKQDYTRFLQQEPMKIGRKYLQFNKAEDEEWMKENWKDLDLLFGGEE